MQAFKECCCHTKVLFMVAISDSMGMVSSPMAHMVFITGAHAIAVLIFSPNRGWCSRFWGGLCHDQERLCQPYDYGLWYS